MKSFSLGLVFGTCAGLVFSLFKDQNGDRLGTNLKSNLIDTKNDATDLQQSLEKAKEAANRLNENLPAAERAINDIEDDVKNYQDHTKYALNEIQYHTDQIKNKLDSSSKEKNN